MTLNKVELCGVNTAKLPLLSEQEKEALFVRIKAGDEEARERYIKGNLRLVLSVIKRFGSSRKRLSISDAPLLRHLSNHLPASRILLARLAESCARHKFHIYSRVPFPLRERFAP